LVNLSVLLGALISELTPKQSIQIEWHWHKLEFSFIIATLGMSLNVTSDFLYPIVVAVSAVTTLPPIYGKMRAVPVRIFRKKTTPKMGKRIAIQCKRTGNRSVSTWQMLRAYMLQIIIHTIIITAIILLSSKFVLPLVENYRFGNQLLR
jgi:CPA2 family monovalent cation:H+ antiporter-2